mgnify:FL=1
MTTAFQNNAFQLDAFQIDAVSGIIYANDQPDTASLAGSVSGTGEVYGTISATDQNDVAALLGTITSANVPDTHDGFTKEEIKRARELDKKLKRAREKLEEAKKQQKLIRKQKLRDLVDPQPIVAKTQQPDLESVKAKEEALAEVIKASAAVKRLETQQAELQRAVALKLAQVQIETELAILNAKRLAEIEDEEALLLLL